MVSIRTAWQLGASGTKGITFGGNSVMALPGQVDVRKVGDGSQNSAVDACLNVLSKAVAEPPIGVAGEDGINFDHPAARLLARPNDWLRGSLLTRHVVYATNAWRHAVLFKVRSAAGKVVALQPLPPTQVYAADGDSELATLDERMEAAAGVGKVITHFVYQATNRAPFRLETQDVVYLRQDIDPLDMKSGRSKLLTALREVLTDDEAATFAAALLSNMGVPGVILVPDLQPGEEGPSSTEADQIAEQFHRRFSGPRRGRPLMMTGKVTPHVLSFTPDQMNFESLRRIPEERISAVLGVPAILAGLGAGLDAATYSNARELREYFTETTVSPTWELLEEEYTYQLLQAEYGGTEAMEYDRAKVAALQEDQDKLWTRWQTALDSGAVTVAEYREALDLEELPETDIFLRPVRSAEVPVGDSGVIDPAPPAPPVEDEEDADADQPVGV